MQVTIASLAPLMPLVAGPVAAGLMQAAKAAPSVPIHAGQVALIRLVLCVLSIAVALGTAWVSGTLAHFDMNAAVKAVFDAAVVYATASATYEHAK